MQTLNYRFWRLQIKFYMPGNTINMRLCEQFLYVHLLTLGYGIIKYCVLLIAKTHVHSSRPNIILSDDISFLSLLWGNRVSLEQVPTFLQLYAKTLGAHPGYSSNVL